MIEAEDKILQDVVTFLSEKTSCHVRNLSLTTDSLNVLTFSGLEIHQQEQMVIHNGDHIPLSHYEFQTLAYLAQHPGGAERVEGEPDDSISCLRLYRIYSKDHIHGAYRSFMLQRVYFCITSRRKKL